MKIILLLLSLVTSLTSFSQYRQRLKEKTFNPTAFKEFKIELKTRNKDKLPGLHYGSAVFIDGRADTSKLGFVMTGEKMDYHRFVFPKPVAAYMTEKAIPLVADSVPKNGNIIIVLKHLWVRQELIRAGLAKSMLTGPIDYLSFCYVNADYYTNDSGHYALLGNIDSVITMKKWIVNAADDLLKKTLTDILETGDSLFMANSSRPAGNKDMSYAELIKKIRGDFELPVLQSQQPQKGVFLTFSDFINNSPAIRDFTSTLDGKTELLRSPGISDENINKAWGYFDGTDLHIHINDNYYKMVRIQNTYEVAGPRQLTKLYGIHEVPIRTAITTFLGGIVSGGVGLMFMGSNNKVMKELVPYQLNIFDGALY